MKNYDLIIVGAGPGGSVAAKTAAEMGVNQVKKILQDVD